MENLLPRSLTEEQKRQNQQSNVTGKVKSKVMLQHLRQHLVYQDRREVFCSTGNAGGRLRYKMYKNIACRIRL